MEKKSLLALGVAVSLLFTTSCAGKNEPNRQAAGKYADDDAELYMGDAGVEPFIYTSRVQSLAASNSLTDPNGYPLIRQFPNTAIPPVQGKYVENVIQTARSYLGTPYVYGSDRTEPSSFDCSDFTRWVFLYSLGMDLPWDSRSQAAYVQAFSKKTYTSLNDARRGDLLFFTSYRGNQASDYQELQPHEKPITHIGIYLGNGYIIHSASQKSGGVSIKTLKWRQLNNRFLFGGGILP
jgi:cell wall-associated NlpC family hydrolase